MLNKPNVLIGLNQNGTRPGMNPLIPGSSWTAGRRRIQTTSGRTVPLLPEPLDYAGQTAPIIDRQTGEIRQAQIFVAVLGASSYTFPEATWSQKLPDWLGPHARCFAFFGGTSQILVPDNLRSGVTKAHRYEPDINPSYRDLAEHYGVAVLPARSRKSTRSMASVPAWASCAWVSSTAKSSWKPRACVRWHSVCVQLQKPGIDPAPRLGTAAAGPAKPAVAARGVHQSARPRSLPLT